MARSRKKKNERKDFQKVKFKVGKQKPKGLNATDTAFKSKGVTVLAQFQSSNSSVISVRGLGIKDICSLLSHRLSSQRTFAYNELADYLQRYPHEAVDHLGDLLNAILPRLMDEEDRLRNRTYLALTSLFRILGADVRTILEPFATTIINYIICGLTHINAAIGTQSLQAVDLVTKFLALEKIQEEAGKLLKALLSMVSSLAEHQKKRRETVIRLLSVGHFATKPARILVLARILAVVEATCHVEPRQTLSEEIVMWDITEPKSFVLRSNLPVDLEPRPVVLVPAKSPGPQSLSTSTGFSTVKNRSPVEGTTEILLYVIKFMGVFWPTVADQFGEGTVTFEDLAGRRCCQDVLKSMLVFLRHLFMDDEKFDINTISEAFLDTIKVVTGQNPLSNRTVSASKDTPKGFYKQVPEFVRLVLPTDSNSRRGHQGVDLLNLNALSLLEIYLQFVTDTRGSKELVRKLNHEVTKLEKYLKTIPHAGPSPARKNPVFDSSENVPVFDYSKNTQSARLDMVLLDHSYFAHAPVVHVGEEDVPSPVMDVIVVG